MPAGIEPADRISAPTTTKEHRGNDHDRHRPHHRHARSRRRRRPLHPALHPRGVATDQAHRILISGNQKDIGALMALLTELPGDPVIARLDIDDLVCALHTLAEQQQDTSQEDLSSRQRAVTGKVCDGWDEDLAASLREQCNDRPATDLQPMLCAERITYNQRRCG
jgi:hypothetical protein